MQQIEIFCSIFYFGLNFQPQNTANWDAGLNIMLYTRFWVNLLLPHPPYNYYREGVAVFKPQNDEVIITAACETIKFQA